MGRFALKRALSVVALVAALFALSGCFKVGMNMTVKADDTVDGSMVFAISKDLAAMAGDSLMDESGFNAQDLEDLGATVDVKPYSDDKFVGQEMTFSGLPLDSIDKTFSDPGTTDTFNLTHDGDTYVFDASLDMSGALSDASGGTGATDDPFSSGMMESMLQDAEFTVSMTFPGSVTDSNGTVDGNTVTWDLDLNSVNELHAEAGEGGALATASAKVEDALGIPLAAVIGIGVAVLALLGLGVLLWMRSKNPTAPSGPIPPGATLPPPPGSAPAPTGEQSDVEPTQVLTDEPEATPSDTDETPPDEPTTRL